MPPAEPEAPLATPGPEAETAAAPEAVSEPQISPNDLVADSNSMEVDPAPAEAAPTAAAEVNDGEPSAVAATPIDTEAATTEGDAAAGKPAAGQWLCLVSLIHKLFQVFAKQS